MGKCTKDSQATGHTRHVLHEMLLVAAGVESCLGVPCPVHTVDGEARPDVGRLASNLAGVALSSDTCRTRLEQRLESWCGRYGEALRSGEVSGEVRLAAVRAASGLLRVGGRMPDKE